MSTHARPRQPAGVPAGGQFATAARTEPAVDLVTPGYSPGPSASRPADRSPEHARLADLGVPAGKLSLLAPVEAKSVLGTVPPQGLTDRDEARATVDAYLRWRDLADTGKVHELRARRILDEATGQLAAAQRGLVDANEQVRAGSADGPLLQDEAAQDVSVAVRRFDDARADLRYLTDPQWRESSGALSMADYFALHGARRRFANDAYRGQVHL